MYLCIFVYVYIFYNICIHTYAYDPLKITRVMTCSDNKNVTAINVVHARYKQGSVMTVEQTDVIAY